jgi:hypothetical protein
MPTQPVATKLREEFAQPDFIVVVGREIVVDRGDRLIGLLGPLAPRLDC